MRRRFAAAFPAFAASFQRAVRRCAPVAELKARSEPCEIWREVVDFRAATF